MLSLEVQVQANILEYFVVCLWEMEGTGLLKNICGFNLKIKLCGFSYDMISCTQHMSVLNKLHFFLAGIMEMEAHFSTLS